MTAEEDKVLEILMSYPFERLERMFFLAFQINVPRDILDDAEDYIKANVSRCILAFYKFNWGNKSFVVTNVLFQCKVCGNYAYFVFPDFKNTCKFCLPNQKESKREWKF